jgi:hypothetical protein
VATEARALVLTSINPPTPAIRDMSTRLTDWSVIVVGDAKSPADWQCDGATFLSLKEQLGTSFDLAAALPQNHYSRKNIGYLAAIANGATVIAETDDDNLPYESFLADVSEEVRGQAIRGEGWVNVYAHFTDARIWPRGFPLELVHESLSRPIRLSDVGTFVCPVQQFLADGDPDVDAVYRLTSSGDIRFAGGNVVLEPGSVCPFNSQNTIWWQDAFPFLYLPSFVTFRMTDIWRSFVASRCLAAMDMPIAFCGPTVYQERNAHSLIRDFEDEVPGYLNNVEIVKLLFSLDLKGMAATDALMRCYEALADAGFVPPNELSLVQHWVTDVCTARAIHA